MDDSPAQNQPGSQPLPQDNGPTQGDVASPPPPLDTQPFSTADDPSSGVSNIMPPASPPPPPSLSTQPFSSDPTSAPPNPEPAMSSSSPQTPPVSPGLSEPLPTPPPEPSIGGLNETSTVGSISVPSETPSASVPETPIDVGPAEPPTPPAAFSSQAPFVPEQSASVMPDPLPMEHPIVPSHPAPEMPPSLEPAPPPVPPPPPPPPPPPSGEVTLMREAGFDNQYGTKSAWYKSKLILSVFIILLAAVLVVGGLFILQKRGGTPQEPTEETTVQPTQPPKPAGLTLSIDSPKEGEVFDTQESTVSGKTLPNTVVVFISDADQNSVESDATGAFSGTVKVAQGLNEITIVAVSTSGEEKSELRYVVYEAQ